MVTLCHNKIFLNADRLQILQGSSVLHVPSVAAQFFSASIKGSSVVMNCLERSLEVGQMSNDEYDKKIRRFYSVASLTRMLYESRQNLLDGIGSFRVECRSISISKGMSKT